MSPHDCLDLEAMMALAASLGCRNPSVTITRYHGCDDADHAWSGVVRGSDASGSTITSSHGSSPTFAHAALLHDLRAKVQAELTKTEARATELRKALAVGATQAGGDKP